MYKKTKESIFFAFCPIKGAKRGGGQSLADMWLSLVDAFPGFTLKNTSLCVSYLIAITSCLLLNAHLESDHQLYINKANMHKQAKNPGISFRWNSRAL